MNQRSRTPVPKYDPATTLEVYSIKEEGSVKPHSVTRKMWDACQEAIWVESRVERMAGRRIPMIDRYDYNVDHGVIVLLEPSAFSIERVKALVLAAKARNPENGAPWFFRAFLKSELPSLVQLTFQLDKRYKLPNPTEIAVSNMMAEIAIDNRWPSDDAVNVVAWFWVPYRNADHRPTGKGYWLIRFRVPVTTAEYIRDIQKGTIQVLASTVTVHHMSVPCRGAITFELVHSNDPVSPQNNPDPNPPNSPRRN